jgi:cell division protein FtsZ
MTPGLINLDFADVKAVMSGAGSALMGIGHASGETRAEEAAENAVTSPLLESSIDGAKGVLLSIAGPSNLALHEVNRAAEAITRVAHPDANIIFGAVIDDSLGDECRVTVIAAGFDKLGTGTTRPGFTRRREAVDMEPLPEEEDDIPIPSLLQDPEEEEQDLFQPAPAAIDAEAGAEDDLDIPDFLK